jgi:hypothetical protein
MEKKQLARAGSSLLIAVFTLVLLINTVFQAEAQSEAPMFSAGTGDTEIVSIRQCALSVGASMPPTATSASSLFSLLSRGSCTHCDRQFRRDIDDCYWDAIYCHNAVTGALLLCVASCPGHIVTCTFACGAIERAGRRMCRRQQSKCNRDAHREHRSCLRDCR